MSRCLIQEGISDKEIFNCWPVIKELNPHVLEKEFVPRIQEQRKEGYRLMFIQDKHSELVVAIMGFRVQNSLWSGKTLYIDDLCTLSTARRNGYASQLLDWVEGYATEENCESISLDSVYTRHPAHRLYLNNKFYLESHHFRKNIK